MKRLLSVMILLFGCAPSVEPTTSVEAQPVKETVLAAQRYEHLRVLQPQMSDLDVVRLYERDGWELVVAPSYAQAYWWFKRPVIKNAE